MERGRRGGGDRLARNPCSPRSAPDGRRHECRVGSPRRGEYSLPKLVRVLRTEVESPLQAYCKQWLHSVCIFSESCLQWLSKPALAATPTQPATTTRARRRRDTSPSRASAAPSSSHRSTRPPSAKLSRPAACGAAARTRRPSTTGGAACTRRPPARRRCARRRRGAGTACRRRSRPRSAARARSTPRASFRLRALRRPAGRAVHERAPREALRAARDLAPARGDVHVQRALRGRRRLRRCAPRARRPVRLRVGGRRPGLRHLRGELRGGAVGGHHGDRRARRAAARRAHRGLPLFAAARTSHLPPDFNVSVCDGFDASASAVLRTCDESHRFVQTSAESTSIRTS